MKISRYVVINKNKYFNTLTKTSLSLDSTEDELESNFFKEGQEKEALKHALFKAPKFFELRLVPTWECNLRCKHCSVLHKLKKKSDCNYSPDLINNFVQLLSSTYSVNELNISILGGEALLKAKEILSVLRKLDECNPDLKILVTITTNLALELDQDMLDLLSYCSNSITISVDGNEDEHNWQRKSLNKDVKNPYSKTLSNIKKLIDFGFKDYLKVQAAIQDSQNSEERKIEFYKTFLNMGLDIDKISYGCVHPTVSNKNVDKTYLENFKRTSLYNHPCCDYRYMSYFLINPDNIILNSYYNKESILLDLNKVESFDEDLIANLERNYKDNINKNMSILQDDTCLNECEVVGYCWGKCVNNDIFNKNKPSNYCDRKNLTKLVQLKAKKNSL